MSKLKLNYQVPILESSTIDGDFIIEGTAINSTTTSNNHKFLTEELQLSATSLTGVPLLVDHRNEVSAIKGRVIQGAYDSENEKVNFRAKVVDKSVKEMIKDGRLNSVSVGADVKEIDEEDGVLIPRGIIFRELSMVAVPADSGATFNIALKEAFQSSKGEINISIERGLENMEEAQKDQDLDKMTILEAEFNKLKEEVAEIKSWRESLEVKEAKEEVKEADADEVPEVQVEAEAEKEVEKEVAKEESESEEEKVEISAEVPAKEEAEVIDESKHTYLQETDQFGATSYTLVRNGN